MKDRALFHLMMTSARSVRSLVPARESEIDQICSTLAISKEGRGPVLIEWRDNTATRSIEVDGKRFSFYARGDVAAIVARRRDGIDLRADNWDEAHRLWGELLGDEHLAQLKNAGGRAIPIPGPPPRRIARIALVCGPALALATTALALQSSASTVALAVLIGALASAIVSPPQLPAFGLVPMGAALLTVVVVVDPSWTEARGPLAGVALIVAATRLAPDPTARAAHGAAGVVLAVLAAGGALAVTGLPFVVGAAIVVVTAIILRQERTRLAATSLAAFVSIAIGVVATQATDRSPSGTPDEANAFAMFVLVVGAIALVLAAVNASVLGVRTHFAPVLAPVVLAVIAIIEIREPVTLVWLIPCTAGVVVSSVVDRVLRSRRSAAPRPREELARPSELRNVRGPSPTDEVAVGLPRRRD